MILYNGQLKILYDMVCKKEHLKVKYEELIEQKSVLQEEVDKLQKISIKEQADVDKLECGSLAIFFLNVIGKKDKKLNKEKEEAYAAKVKYDAAKKELEKVESELRAMKEEVSKLHGCEEEYEALLVLKKERMKTIGHEAMIKVFELDQRMTYLDNQNREIDEAIEAGNAALEATNQVLKELDSDENSGIFDILGGGFFVDMFKYSKLDEAQSLVEKLQHSLRRFKTELSDITIDPEVNILIDGFLKFTDCFFDNLFTDWSVLLRFQKSKGHVKDTKEQIVNLIEKLQKMREKVVEERAQTQDKLDELIVHVNM